MGCQISNAKCPNPDTKHKFGGHFTLIFSNTMDNLQFFLSAGEDPDIGLDHQPEIEKSRSEEKQWPI
jgi:hypothetical protein